MPWELDPVVIITGSVGDKKGKTATLEMYVSSVNTVTEIDLSVRDYFGPRTQAITSGRVDRFSATYTWSNSDAPAPAQDSFVPVKGLFSFNTSNDAVYKIEVPSFRDQFVLDRTDNILVTAPEVAAFIDLMISPGTLAWVRPRTYLGSDITELDRAYLMTRTRKRGRR